MKKYLFLLSAIVLFSCSTKKNTFISRNYHMLTTRYNVYFNGSQSMKAGEKKIIEGYKVDYNSLLPIYICEDEGARSAAFSDMDRAAVKAMKAIKLHSITNKPKRRSNPSEKYKEFRKKKEFNKIIDDCYLLKGKADYYNKKYQKADKAFKFIIRRFSGEEIVFDARLWYGRSLIEQKQFAQAKEQLRSLNKKGVPEKYYPEILRLSAYYGLKTNNVDFAVDNLERMVALLKGKNKARYYYILAQLCLGEGDNLKAMGYFDKVVKMRVSYDMSFNARINRSVAFTGRGESELLRDLNSMLKNKKNKDYRDQIYYALANVYMKKGDFDKSLECYWKSTKVSVGNDAQKSRSFKVLGYYYYDIKDYRKAHLCYDSCFYYNSSDFSESKSLMKRRSSLSGLVEGLDVVFVQDSLRALGRMSEADRNAIIDAKIEIIKEKDEFLREQKRKADLDRSFYMQNRTRNSSMQNSYSQSSGGWYFYNQGMVSGGRTEFSIKWGRRKLEDNWNRKNKAIVESLDLEEEADDVSEKKGSGVRVDKDPKSRDFYLQDIPLTKEKIVESDSLILESLFSVGEIYSDILNDYASAISVYEDIIERYPENKYLLYIYYSCYNSAYKLGNHPKVELYKSRIVSQFPKSEYAKLVLDRGYLYSMQNKLTVVEELYKKALKAFEREEFSYTVSVCDDAISNYPKSELRDKFIILRLYALAKYISPGDLKRDLLKVMDLDLNEEAKFVVMGIMDVLNRGGVSDNTAVNKSKEVESIKADKDEFMKYTFTPESRHYFILSIPRTAKNLDRLLFKLNVVCADVIESSLLDVRKEMLGDNTIMFVVSVLENREEASVLHKEMIKDKELAYFLEGTDYRMFSISEANYKILKFGQNLDEYLKFYSEKYLDNIEGVIGSLNREDFLFTYNDNANHDFVILFPFKFVDDDVLKSVLRKFDSDYSVELDDFNTTHQAVIVRNVGYSADAMQYYSAINALFRNDNKDIYPLLEMMVISSGNYKVMYENKFDKEYLTYFKNHYKENTFDIKEEMESGGFTYNEDDAHYFVICFPDSVNDKKLLSAFKRYNTSDLPVQIHDYDDDLKMLIVSNLANKKQGMIYYRAVLSNSILYKQLRRVEYKDYIISKDNFEKLKSKNILDKYFELFNKWYLNK